MILENFKRWGIYCLSIFVLLPSIAFAQESYVPDEVLVRYKEAPTVERSAMVAEPQSFTLSEYLEEQDISVLKITDGTSVEDAIAQLEEDPNVEYAEPNYTRDLFIISSDDTFKDRLWGLDNIGQLISGDFSSTTGSVDADIDAPEAWAISEGLEDIIVAVIDGGVLYTHPDLASNMWNGSGCVTETGADLGGCLYGYDYQNDDISPLPGSSHGTHVAGSIAAVKNNTVGVTGVAPNAKIMALRFALNISTEVKAIDFAIQNGAKIINASFGGTGYSVTEYEAIERFKDAGGIFVAAAGNCGDVDTYESNGCSSQNQTLYPASYDLENIISVAATDQNDDIAEFSNTGAESTDVGAPGVNIYSTITGNSYGYSSGTSMASPYTAGLAALIWAYNPDLSAQEVKDIILQNGDTKESLEGLTVSGKRINAQKSLFAVDILSAQALHDDAVEGTSSATYIIGSKAIFQSAIDLATEIKNNGTSTDTDITTAVDVLNTAIETFLVSINPESEPDLELSDLSVLTNLIAEAQTLLDDAEEGTSVGKYAAGSKAVLEEAITEALSITEEMSQEVVDEAVTTLNDAIETFEDGIVKKKSGGGGGGGGGAPKVKPSEDFARPLLQPVATTPVTVEMLITQLLLLIQQWEALTGKSFWAQ